MSHNFKIKNIIFDLGGVLIDVDEKKTIECFGHEITAFYNNNINPDFVKLAHKFEKGEITSSYFRKNVCKIFNINVTDEIFDRCWNAMVQSMPTSRINMLLYLRETYNIFALSNTNEIHYKYFTNQDFWEPKIFKNVYFSHILGMRKPDAEIFEFVLNDNKLNPEETLFYDDNLQNIESARKLGLIAIHVNKEIETLVNQAIKFNETSDF